MEFEKKKKRENFYASLEETMEPDNTQEMEEKVIHDSLQHLLSEQAEYCEKFIEWALF